MNSVVALQILVWASVFIFMSIPFGNLLNCLNRQSIVTKVTGICLVSNVILNLMLTPRYGLIGASISFVLTEFVSLGISFIWTLRMGYSIPKHRFLNIIIQVLIASMLMGGFVFSFRDLNLFVLLPSAMVLYFLLLYLGNGIDKEDLSLLRLVVRGR
jgi:O-antigen/teichoic acid export membrane protein